MNRTAALIVTYNRKELLTQCIEALLEMPCDIIVIDNASTDGTEATLSSFIGSGQISYHNTGANLGGAGGFNFAIKTALKQGYEYM